LGLNASAGFLSVALVATLASTHVKDHCAYKSDDQAKRHRKKPESAIEKLMDIEFRPVMHAHPSGDAVIEITKHRDPDDKSLGAQGEYKKFESA